MSDVRVNYMLATWSGGRRQGCTYGNNTFQHLRYLNRVKHNISQVTVGYPTNPNDLPEYKRFMNGLKSLENNVPIVVERLPNKGRSYGQYSRIFDKYRSQFDYYIFMEDDYVPVMDNFDTKLVEKFDKLHEEKNCGFLCGMVERVKFRIKEPNQPLHAAIAWGISSYNVLERIWEENGMLPHDTNIKYRDGQNLFSWGFMKSGYTLQDVLDEYCTTYWSKEVEYYGDKKKPIIFAPLELVLSNKKYGPIPSSPFSPVSRLKQQNSKKR